MLQLRDSTDAVIMNEMVNQQLLLSMKNAEELRIF